MPLLVIHGGDAEAEAAGEQLTRSLQLNSRLSGDYYVARFEGCADDFVLLPGSEHERQGAERAVSLTTAWLDRFVPEQLGAR